MEEEYKYVWLNINTGEFSNSWNEEVNRNMIGKDPDLLENSKRDGYKLIKFRCLNDEDFEFSKFMRLR